MSKQLPDILRKHFSEIFNEEDKEIDINGNLVAIALDGRAILYSFEIVNDTLCVGDIINSNGTEGEIIRNILRLNEAAARDIGLVQVVYGVEDKKDREVVQKEGYIFKDENLIGIKRLK